MLNYKIIFKIMSMLLLIESCLFLFCIGISFLFGCADTLSFLYSIGVAVMLSLVFSLLGRGASRKMGKRDGYFIVSVTWLLFSAVGMLPFIFSGAIPSVTDAFFETMSGFTSTGATILDEVERLSPPLLFWRSFTQWIGGLGIVFFTIALLPAIGMNDFKLFSAESTRLKLGKLHPRIRTTAKWIWSLYFIITATCIAAFYFCGMSFFDAACHAFTTTGTGGYSTHTESFAYFQSPLLEYVDSFFMLLSGINFSLLYIAIVKRRPLDLLRDTEAHTYLGITLSATAVIAICLYTHNNLPVEESFRTALFNVISLQTSTGYTTVDYASWLPLTWVILLFVMFVGGCTGSTSGGMKSIRFYLLVKTTINEFKHILHPNAVNPLRIGHSIAPSTIERSLLAFVFLFASVTFVGALTLVAMGLPLLDAFSLIISSQSNIGPGLGHQFTSMTSWNALPDAGKWVCAATMWVGRLEIFAAIMPFYSGFWKEN